MIYVIVKVVINYLVFASAYDIIITLGLSVYLLVDMGGPLGNPLHIYYTMRRVLAKTR